MNDTYGSEPHDHEGQDGGAPHEETVVQEAPSGYEFSDDDQAITTEPTDALDAKTTQRSPLLPIAAAVGSVLLLGAVAWWQLSGNSSSVMSPPASSRVALSLPSTAAQVPVPAPVPVVAVPPDSGPVAPKTSSAAAQDSSASNAGPLTPDVVAQSVKIAQSANSNAPQTGSTSGAAAPSISPNVTTIPTTPTVVVAAPASATLPSTPTAVAGQTPVNGAADHRIEALTARVDSLQRALDQANQQLSQVTNITASSSAKDLQDRIDKLEQQVALLGSRPMSGVGTEMPVESESVVMPKTHKMGSVHTLKHKMVVHKQIKKAPAPAKIANNWVLRAATPGQAWVASSAASHDLKQVQVGDTLPGIGHITAIEQKGDNWLVQGTKGVIQ